MPAKSRALGGHLCSEWRRAHTTTAQHEALCVALGCVARARGPSREDACAQGSIPVTDFLHTRRLPQSPVRQEQVPGWLVRVLPEQLLRSDSHTLGGHDEVCVQRQFPGKVPGGLRQHCLTEHPVKAAARPASKRVKETTTASTFARTGFHHVPFTYLLARSRSATTVLLLAATVHEVRWLVTAHPTHPTHLCPQSPAQIVSNTHTHTYTVKKEKQNM